MNITCMYACLIAYWCQKIWTRFEYLHFRIIIWIGSIKKTSFELGSNISSFELLFEFEVFTSFEFELFTPFELDSNNLSFELLFEFELIDSFEFDYLRHLNLNYLRNLNLKYLRHLNSVRICWVSKYNINLKYLRRLNLTHLRHLNFNNLKRS
jgi:hypothetical protein